MIKTNSAPEAVTVAVSCGRATTAIWTSRRTHRLYLNFHHLLFVLDLEGLLPVLLNTARGALAKESDQDAMELGSEAPFPGQLFHSDLQNNKG